MIYALIGLLLLQQAIFAHVLLRMSDKAVVEREYLHRKLVALADVKAAVVVNAQNDPVPGNVSYVDEQREWELSPSADGYRDET